MDTLDESHLSDHSDSASDGICSASIEMEVDSQGGQYTILRSVIENDSPEELEALLASNANFLEALLEHELLQDDDKTTVLWITPLALAAALQRPAIVKVLLDHQAEIDAEVSSLGGTALHLAARSGCKASVDLLLSKGATVNQTDKSGSTPLHLASRYGHADIIISLLDGGATLSLRDGEQSTPFHVACMYGQLDVLKTLWDRQPGIQMREKNAFSNQPLHLAAINDQHIIIPWLLQHGAAIGEPGHLKMNALHHACAHGAVRTAEILLDSGANIHQPSGLSTTPILLACLNVQLDVLEVLMDRSALASNVDDEGNTCFHQVILSGKDFSQAHLDILARLRGAGADINKPNAHGFPPLYIACRDEKPHYINSLLKLGADINMKCSSNKGTALMEACCNPTAKAVEILLDRNADMTATNHHGLTALALACRYGLVANVKLLINKEVDVLVKDNDGHTPLCTAAQSSQMEIVLELLKTRDYYPPSPLERTIPMLSLGHTDEIEGALMGGFESSSYETLDQLHTVMFWAISSGCSDLAGKCIDHNPQVLEWRRRGATWLHITAQYEQHELIRQNLFNMDAGTLDDDNVTALHVAADLGTLKTTECLLEMIAGRSKEAPVLSKVRAILEYNSKGESPLIISIRRKHKNLTRLFWDEIRQLGDSDSTFIQENPDEAAEILEILAQYEKPGKEDILRQLLQRWSIGRPDLDALPSTALAWAVYRCQAPVVWWLLSKGGYSSSDAIDDASKLASGLEGEIGKLIQGLFQRPPPILDQVSNPNDDNPPALPKPLKRTNPSLETKGTVVDIYFDGTATRVPYTRRSIEEIIYQSCKGPDALMKEARNLDQRDLDALKKKVRALTKPSKVDARPREGDSRYSRAASSKTALPQQNSSDDEHVQQNSKHIPRAVKVRWIHLPVNDLHLMRDLVTRLSNDAERSEMDHGTLMRHFNGSWTELAAGGRHRFMKPQCTRAWMHRPGQTNNNPSESEGSPRSIAPAALYMPYLTLGTLGSKKLQEMLYHHGTSQDCIKPDTNGLEGLNESTKSRNSRQVTHIPMTLDQYYYPILDDTSKRDQDQVLSRFLQNKIGPRTDRSGTSSEMTSPATDDDDSDRMQILTVDHLWMWIIDETTIITATTEVTTSDGGSPSSLLSGVLDNMVGGESKGRLDLPTSVSSLMELILGVATGFFMKKSVALSATDRRSPIDIFRESIRIVANQEVSLFGEFLNNLEKEENQQEQEKASHSIHKIPPNPYHIISRETKLLNEIRDIRDELCILKTLAEDQETVWKGAFETDELKDCLHYHHPCTPTDINRHLDRMLMEAEETNESINTLLDLRQKQASIKEAEFGRIQANDSARQSNSVFVFTVITIVFLPLSFLSSLFALDVSSFPHESGDIKYESWWLFPILFGVTAIVSIPAIYLAWKVNTVSQWFRPRGRTSSDESAQPSGNRHVEAQQNVTRSLRKYLRRRRNRREEDVLPQ